LLETAPVFSAIVSGNKKQKNPNINIHGSISYCSDQTQFSIGFFRSPLPFCLERTEKKRFQVLIFRMISVSTPAIAVDWPDFLYALVESIKARFNVDSKRVYLFGTSAGGCFAAVTALLEPGYIAAVAVHAGILPLQDSPLSDKRIPIGFWIGGLDRYFSVEAVQDGGRFMYGKGFKVQLTLMPGIGHSFDTKQIQGIWSFLQSKVLAGNPEWTAVGHMRCKLWPWPAGC
jgi:dienelactone hydrolase